MIKSVEPYKEPPQDFKQVMLETGIYGGIGVVFCSIFAPKESREECLKDTGLKTLKYFSERLSDYLRARE